MSRTTIDYGIDLGTTNSEIAVFNGTSPEIIKNNEGAEYTPSAVWIDRNGRIHVGKRARQRLEDDPENAFCEFKLQMGQPTEYVFARTGKRMKPEELSAEVLKSLRADVQRLRGEEVRAAVITVPAAFKLPQCDATNRAARLAGFEVSPLLQEPVAAAMAYGFDLKSENVFWLAYDFGGGTFDAAVIQVRENGIQVVNHGGDNHLGGKLIDWEIVEQILIPEVKRQASVRLVDLRRGNPKCRGAIAKLKMAAEEAKIRCSAEESVEIIIDQLCTDDNGDTVRFEYELQRRDVERLAEPFILRSINICRKVLAEQHLGPDDVERVLLVGGPTMMPYLRQRLMDPKEGLGIALEFSVDPLTVVARGAAVFARTQRLEVSEEERQKRYEEAQKRGEYAIQLEYKPASPDPEPVVGGKVVAPERVDLDGYTIEFVNETIQPNWRSGRVGLSPEGAFMTTLYAEKGPENRFSIELRNPTGTKVGTVPDHLSYIIIPVDTEQPLIHSMGVGLANNEMQFYFRKGEPLPARHREVLRTALPLRRGNASDILRVPVKEGENRRADRNYNIGSLVITGEQVRRDVPVGSEIEVTLDIDSSRLIHVVAEIPILDQEFDDVLKLGGGKPDQRQLEKEFEREKDRWKQLREKVSETGDAEAERVAHRIDSERMVHDVEVSLAAMSADPDAGDKCQNRLLDLRAALDEVEDKLEWPGLVNEAEKVISGGKQFINDPEFKAESDERRQFGDLVRDARRAIDARDRDLLERKVYEMRQVIVTVLVRHPGFWVARFDDLSKRKADMSNPQQAESYIAQGLRAVQSGDVSALRAAVLQLEGLLPAGDPDRKESGVIA